MNWLERPLDALLAMRGALPHALLVVGAPGIGVSELAVAFARSLLCESPAAGGRACGKCLACGWFDAGNHPDLRRVAPEAEGDEDGDAPSSGRKDAARWIRIDQVRALAEFMAVGGHRAGRKVVLLDPAEALNVPAANALLKTLEEPPGNSVFLLVSGRPDALPATIRSRCVVFPVAGPAPDEALAWLAGQPGVESAAHARTLLAAAGGQPLRALDLADPSNAAAFRAVVDGVSRIPDASALQVADLVVNASPRAWVALLQAWTSDLARVAAGASALRFPDQHARLAKLASSTTLGGVTEFSFWLDERVRTIDHPLNARLLCEDVLLRYREMFG